MAWMIPAAMVASTVISGAMNQGGDSKAGGQPMYMMQNMPPEMQQRALAQMNRMPMGANLSYKGQTFPMMYGPQMRAMKQFYSPGGSIPYQNNPSGMSSALAAAAPYMWQMANQTQNQGGGGFNNSMPSNYNPNQNFPYQD